MSRKLVALGLIFVLGGKTTSSMATPGNGIETNSTASRNHENPKTESTDVKIRHVLVEITNRIFKPDDSHLITLIKRGIVEAAKSKPSAAIETGAKKAQAYVTEVTAAYTQAIFRANSPQQAEDILLRFQDTIQRIVEFTKNGDYAA